MNKYLVRNFKWIENLGKVPAKVYRLGQGHNYTGAPGAGFFNYVGPRGWSWLDLPSNAFWCILMYAFPLSHSIQLDSIQPIQYPDHVRTAASNVAKSLRVPPIL